MKTILFTTISLMCLLLLANAKKIYMNENNEHTFLKMPPPATPNLVLNLSKFKLTLPINSSVQEQHGTAAISKTTAQLLAGYTSQYFYVSADSGVTFWCPVTGATTSPGVGSDNPRTELAETSYYKANTIGQMNNVVAINQYPSVSKSITIGQIHSADSANTTYPFVLLNIINGSLRAYIKGELTGNIGAKAKTILTNISLNQKINYTISSNGTFINFSASCPGATGLGSWSDSIPAAFKAMKLRFTAGDYVHDTGSNNTDGGRLTFYQLNIAHNTLPVSLSYFKAAQANDGKINLHWATSKETDNNYFLIERSVDGKGFEAIGQINSKGNTALEQHYNFTDNKPNASTNYYRLKQVDANGKYTYSDIVKVNTTATVKTSVVGFINGNTIKINYADKANTKALLVNTIGKVIGIYNINVGENLIRVDDLMSGVYFININDKTFKIIK